MAGGGKPYVIVAAILEAEQIAAVVEREVVDTGTEIFHHHLVSKVDAVGFSAQEGFKSRNGGSVIFETVHAAGAFDGKVDQVVDRTDFHVFDASKFRGAKGKGGLFRVAAFLGGGIGYKHPRSCGSSGIAAVVCKVELEGIQFTRAKIACLIRYKLVHATVAIVFAIVNDAPVFGVDHNVFVAATAQRPQFLGFTRTVLLNLGRNRIDFYAPADVEVPVSIGVGVVAVVFFASDDRIPGSDRSGAIAHGSGNGGEVDCLRGIDYPEP